MAQHTSRVYSGLPDSDVEILDEAYRISDKKIPDNPTENIGTQQKKFAYHIAYRIYTEYCCANPLKPHEFSEGGRGYKKWVADEIHYEIERRVRALPNQDTSRVNMEQMYTEVRIDVLRAVTARAIDLFSDWGGNPWPPDADGTTNDQRNLRASLEPHIQRT